MIPPAATRRLAGVLAAAAALLPVQLGADDAEGDSDKDAVALYNTNCAGCHGKDGRARTPMAKKLKVRDLTKSTLADGQVERQIREGKQGPGGETLMPSFKSRLSDEEIQRLIARVKQFRERA